MMSNTCTCGCGQLLPPRSKKNPNRGADFIKGHWSRTAAYREMKQRSKAEPPPDWKVPSGVCECGCGASTSIAKTSNLQRDQYAGYPLRYLQHHKRRRVGADSPRWKGGRSYMKGGYVCVWDGANRYRPEHILIWEATHGPIPKGHQIHHLNGIPDDNRLANLVCMNRWEHYLLHYLSDYPDLVRLFWRAWQRNHVQQPPL